MIRTPKGQVGGQIEAPTSPPKTVTLSSKVRKSIGDWEAATTDQPSTSPVTSRTTQADPTRDRKKLALSQDSAMAKRSPIDTRSPPPKPSYSDRTAEARACLCKAKNHLNDSRNLRTDIKNGVIAAVERLYQLVKELDTESRGKAVGKGKEDWKSKETANTTSVDVRLKSTMECGVIEKMEEHTKKLIENNRKIDELKTIIEEQKGAIERITYASVTSQRANPPSSSKRETLHSVVVASKNETDSGKDVLDRVRKAVDAKEGWITVQRVRKAKDSKVILGFKTQEEQNKIKDKLSITGGHLIVEEVKNKDPLLILKDVLQVQTDEEVLKAFRKQNQSVFHNLSEEEDRATIKYRRKAMEW